MNPLALFWELAAWVITRPRVSAWLIERAQRTPYRHITSADGREVYMRRWWLFNAYPDPMAPGSAPAPRHIRWLPSVRVHHISRADMLAQLRATGAINETRRVQSIAAAVRRRPGLVLDMETARALRADDRSALAIERATGINHETVSKVRRGKLWRELVASPWAGMGGRP